VPERLPLRERVLRLRIGAIARRVVVARHHQTGRIAGVGEDLIPPDDRHRLSRALRKAGPAWLRPGRDRPVALAAVGRREAGLEIHADSAAVAASLIDKREPETVLGLVAVLLRLGNLVSTRQRSATKRRICPLNFPFTSPPLPPRLNQAPDSSTMIYTMCTYITCIARGVSTVIGSGAEVFCGGAAPTSDPARYE
jgi:hypothetical protein